MTRQLDTQGIAPPNTPASPAAPLASRDRTVLFAFSLVLLTGIATITFVSPFFSAQQWFTYLCILGLAAGGFTAFLPGALDWQISPQMRATGAIAMVLVVIGLGSRVEGIRTESRNWALVSDADDAPNPDDAVVYVSLDDQVVKASGTSKPEFPIRRAAAGKDISVDRGSGGILVNVPRAVPGQRLLIFVEHQSRWWKSREIRIPPTDRLELKATNLEELRRRIP
jgi:hypothetical protein